MRPLETVDAQWLIQQPFTRPAWIIEDLVTVGLTLLVGAPKAGKSWMSLKIALCVSMGQPFWGLQTLPCDVLYLSLEDTPERVQQRLWKLTDEASPRLHIGNAAGKVNDDLISQLEGFFEAYPETKLVIIDTLQMIRKGAGDVSYAADYADMSALKKFADSHGAAILCVHHNRKMGDQDVFNTVSGTNGITGAADCTMVLSNLNRASKHATLSVTGRDVDFQEYKVKLTDCVWELIEKTSKEELEERDVPDDVLRTLDFMMTRPVEWKGTTTELFNVVGIDGVSVPAYGKHLAQHKDFMAERGILFDRVHMREGNILTLRRAEADRDGCEGCDGKFAS